MSRPISENSRCFLNNLPDYHPGTNSEPPIPAKFLQTNIKTLLTRIIDSFPATINNADGGLYVGCAGVVYTFYKILMMHVQDNSILDLNQSQISSYLKASQAYLDVSLTNPEKLGCLPGAAFLLGNGGVNVVSACFYTFMQAYKPNNQEKNSRQINEYTELTEICLKSYSVVAAQLSKVDLMDCGSDELFIGRAGYLCGLYYLEKQFKNKIVADDAIHKILTAMIKSGRQYASKFKLKIPLMYAYYQTQYLGAAHGLSSILQMMLNYKSVLESIPNALSDVRKCIDALVATQWYDGNFSPTLEESQHIPDHAHELVHWCHGAPGVVYLMAKAYLVFRDEKYLQSALRCGELTWNKGLLKKGPGLCHGVAGNGYVFLTLYRLTGCRDGKWLHRAIQFAQFIFTPKFQDNARIPDCPYSLYEGVAGTVCFLADLLRPNTAHFPFFDVFD